MENEDESQNSCCSHTEWYGKIAFICFSMCFIAFYNFEVHCTVVVCAACLSWMVARVESTIQHQQETPVNLSISEPCLRFYYRRKARRNLSAGRNETKKLGRSRGFS